MSFFSFLLKNVSEDNLRSIEGKMRYKLDSMDYESKKHTKLDLRRIDIVNEISSRNSGSSPKREHGRYLLNDE